VPQALNELHRTSSKYVLLAIPQARWFFEIIINFSLLEKFFKKPCLTLDFGMRKFYKKVLNGEHYWEFGSKGFPPNKIRALLKTKFKIITEFKPPLTQSRFLLLEKIKSNLD